MFHNLLVCVDGSCHSQRALAEAIDIAAAGNGRITLLAAIPRPPYWVSSPATAAAVEPLSADMGRQARSTLTAAIERIPESIPVTSVLSEKPIRDAIMDRLADGHHDLLVMGSRGRGALSAQFLGSVSHYALNHAAVPVLIVHTDRDVSDPEAVALAATA